jgi:hypothetical protein
LVNILFYEDTYLFIYLRVSIGAISAADVLVRGLMWASFPVRGYIRRGSPALHRPLLMATNYNIYDYYNNYYLHNDHPRICLPQVDQLTSMDQDKPLVVKYASLSPAHRRSFLRRVAIEPGEVSKSVQSDQWRATWQKRSFKLAPRCSLLALNLPSRI